jgi:protein phosphatase
VSIDVRWGTASHAGHLREVNEDAVLAAPPVFAVADGMGGHEAGDVASALAVEALERFRGATALAPDSVVVAVHDANAEIAEHARRLGPGTLMGTTIAGIALARHGESDQVVAFNVGDSRVYRCRDGRLEQLSEDHSIVADLVRAGEVSAEDARQHPHQHVVTRALGVHDAVDVDRWVLEPRRGDRFLVCSDGLVGELTDDAIAEHLGGNAGPQETADSLLAAALAGDARDNISVVVVDVVDTGETLSSPADDDTNPRPRRRHEDVESAEADPA